MNLQKHTAGYLLSLSVALAVAVAPVWSQSQSSVQVVSLRTQNAPNGQQLVTIPSGQTVPLPGPGVNGNRVDVYMGSQGGVWYVDRTGQNFDLTPYAQRMQAMQQASSQSSSYNSQSNSNAGVAAGAAAAGAAVGAAAGYAYGNYNDQYGYGDVPYGYAVGVAADGRHYYNSGNGNAVYVNNSQNNYNAAIQQQQQWYQRQQQQDPERYRNWQQAGTNNNPFVARGDAPAADGGRRHRGPGDGHGPFGAGGPSADRRFANDGPATNNAPGANMSEGGRIRRGPGGDGPGLRRGQDGPQGGPQGGLRGGGPQGGSPRGGPGGPPRFR